MLSPKIITLARLWLAGFADAANAPQHYILHVATAGKILSAIIRSYPGGLKAFLVEHPSTLGR